MTLLTLEGITVRYGGVVAVRELSLDVAPGEVVALLGANGAGKTSTLRAISGLVRPTGGRVLFDGEDITHAPTDTIARAGVAHVPAGRGVLGNLSVADNLHLALYAVRAHRTAAGRRRLDEVYATFSGLAGRRGQPAGQMSGGQQQQLAIGRALVQAPRLLLVDEMSMGLAPLVVADLFRVVAGLRDQGIAVVVVEQFVGQALRVCDRAVVLQQGRIVAAGRREDLSAADVAAAYLGGAEAASSLDIAPPPADSTEGVRVELGGRQVRSLERLAASRGVPVGQLVGESVARLLAEADGP
jgi:branched-chain amino acid transport system ATP-binding protein